MVNSNFREIIRATRLSLLCEGQLLLYGYYNSEQHLIQVKICTAVDKDKGITEDQEIKWQVCNDKLRNADIAVFLCRKLLMFGVEYGIMIFNDTMY